MEMIHLIIRIHHGAMAQDRNLFRIQALMVARALKNIFFYMRV